MAIPSWSWPPSGAQARGVALAPFGTGDIVVPDWTEPVLWPFNLSSQSFLAGITVGSGSNGFGSATVDPSGNLWATTWDGLLYRTLPPAGTVTYSAAMPTGQIYVGTAYCAGNVVSVAASGQVYNSTTAGFGTFPLPVCSVAASGDTIAGLMPSSGVSLMNNTGGIAGFIALPVGMATGACMALASGGPLALGGWSNAAPLSGAAAAAPDPQGLATMLAVGSGHAFLWEAPGQYADAWSQVQALTGLLNLTSVAWRPDGTQALVTDPVSGMVQVLGYLGGSISLAQSLAVSGALAVAVAGDSVHALVAQSGHAQATQIAYTGSWVTSGSPIGGLPGIAALIPYGPSGAVAAVTGGLQYLQLVGGLWASGATVPLGFSPSCLTQDAFGQVYAGTGADMAIVSGSTVVASGTFSGNNPAAVAVQQGRIIVSDPVDGVMHVLALSAPGTVTQQNTVALASGTTGLALSTTTLFVMQPSGTALYGFSGSPFALTAARSGIAALWNGSSWTTRPMGIGHVPGTIGIDASGGAWVATIQNTLWHLSSGAAVLTSGTLQQVSGQPQTVPLCPSAILVSGGGTYVATSIPGFLERVA